MGCRSDYMQPTRQEQDLADSASMHEKLENQKREIERQALDEKKKKEKELITILINFLAEKLELTDLPESTCQKLCSMLQSLTEKQINDWVYDAHNTTSRKLADWWEKHQEDDRKYLREDLKKIKRHQEKIDFLSKLNEYEFKLLNL